MVSKKIKYYAQVALMLIVFFIVLSGLIYKFTNEMQSGSRKQTAVEIEKRKTEFIATIENRYQEIKRQYQAEEYAKTIAAIEVFESHGKSDYKDLQEIKKEIWIRYLKKKLDFIPKIQLDQYIQKLKKEKRQKDTSTQVFIRQPIYGQYFFSPSDLPIVLEGIALSLIGDFSDDIIWTSSIDGNLGKGKQLTVRLSIGDHHISATATNGVTTGTMETLIYIKPEHVSVQE